jgi:hypothetical protein
MSVSPSGPKPYIVTYPGMEGYFIRKSSQKDLKEPVRKAAETRKRPVTVFGQLYWTLDKNKFQYRYLTEEEVKLYGEEGPWNKKLENAPVREVPVREVPVREESPGETYLFPEDPSGSRASPEGVKEPREEKSVSQVSREEFDDLKRLITSLKRENELLRAQTHVDLYYEDRFNKLWEEVESLRREIKRE